MKLFKPNNFFSSFIFCDLLAKLIGAQFLTIQKNKHGSYFAITSIFDVLRVLIALALGTWMAKFILDIKMEVNSGRSIIFEIMTVANGKFQGSHSFIIALLFLFLRNEYFKIIKNIHDIDVKVTEPEKDFLKINF